MPRLGEEEPALGQQTQGLRCEGQRQHPLQGDRRPRGDQRQQQKRLCPNGDKSLTSIRVVHASPDAPNVDVYVDGTLAIENLPFGEATDLLPIPAGARNIKVTPAGATPIEPGPPIAPGAPPIGPPISPPGGQ